MHNWTADQVNTFLERSPLAARVRLSPSKSFAQIDIYHCAGKPCRELVAELKAGGWVFAGRHETMPYSIAGYFYQHWDVSPRRVKATRDIMLKYLFLEEARPTPTPAAIPPPIAATRTIMLALPAPPRLLLLSPPRLEWQTPQLHEEIIWHPIETWPRKRKPIIVRGPYHDCLTVHFDGRDQWYPWVAGDRRYRWDLFDFWSRP